VKADARFGLTKTNDFIYLFVDPGSASKAFSILTWLAEHALGVENDRAVMRVVGGPHAQGTAVLGRRRRKNVEHLGFVVVQIFKVSKSFSFRCQSS